MSWRCTCGIGLLLWNLQDSLFCRTRNGLRPGPNSVDLVSRSVSHVQGPRGETRMDALLEWYPQEPDAKCDWPKFEVGPKSVVDRSLHRSAGHVTMRHSSFRLWETAPVMSDMRQRSADASNGFVAYRTTRVDEPPALICRPVSLIVLPLRSTQTATLLSERWATPMPRQLAGTLTSKSCEHLPPALRKKSLWHDEETRCTMQQEIDASITSGRRSLSLRKTDTVSMRVAHELMCVPTMRPPALRADWLFRGRLSPRHFTVTEEWEALSFHTQYCFGNKAARERKDRRSLPHSQHEMCRERGPPQGARNRPLCRWTTERDAPSV